MEQQNFPQFYKKPVILNKDEHAGLTLAPSPTGLSFAAQAQTVLLATVELFDACREFPVIFTRAQSGAIVPLALLGLEAGENLFVEADGRWHGSYIPAYIRRYPFITTDGSDGQQSVCFDEDFDGWNSEDGRPLFADGEPTPQLQEILALIEDYQRQMQATEEFGAILANAGLLKQIDAQASLVDGRTYTLTGMLVVDEQKLTQLPDVDIVKLFRIGMMALINAHLLSLRNLNRLIERKASRP